MAHVLFSPPKTEPSPPGRARTEPMRFSMLITQLRIPYSRVSLSPPTARTVFSTLRISATGPLTCSTVTSTKSPSVARSPIPAFPPLRAVWPRGFRRQALCHLCFAGCRQARRRRRPWSWFPRRLRHQRQPHSTPGFHGRLELTLGHDMGAGRIRQIQPRPADG